MKKLVKVVLIIAIAFLICSATYNAIWKPCAYALCYTGSSTVGGQEGSFADEVYYRKILGHYQIKVKTSNGVIIYDCGESPVAIGRTK